MLLADPEVALSGLPATNLQGVPLESIARDAAIGTIESIPKPRRKDQALVSEAVRRAVRAAVNQAWGKKPMCSVLALAVLIESAARFSLVIARLDRAIPPQHS